MSWIVIGILIGIGIILAPLVLMVGYFVGVFVLLLLGIPAVGAAAGWLVATKSDADPMQGALLGLGIGVVVNILMWVVFTVDARQRRDKRIADEIIEEIALKRDQYPGRNELE